jgi:uncharacterized protein YuzE
MRLSFDTEADAMFLILKEGPWDRTKQVARGINLELDESGEVLAIEVLFLSKRAGRPILKHLDIDLAPPFDPDEESFDIPDEVFERLQRKMTALKDKAKSD